MREPHFLHLDTNSQKLKVDQNFLVGPSQKWCRRSGFGTLKLLAYLKNEQMELTDFLEAVEIYTK